MGRSSARNRHTHPQGQRARYGRKGKRKLQITCRGCWGGSEEITTAKYSQAPPLQGSGQPVSQARKWAERLGELHKTTLPGTVAGDTAWRKFYVEFECACG